MVQQIGSAEWEELVIGSDTPVLVDFFATWCGPCKSMATVVDEIATEQAGKIAVYKLDIDEDPDIPQQFKIMSIPTFLAFKGGELLGRKVGVQSKEDLLGLFN